MADLHDSPREGVSLFKAHPWHGVPLGDRAPEVVNAYIEMVPTDKVKYEIDKATGHLTIDRPQQFTSMSPTLYGFLPRTYCGPRVAAFCAGKVGRSGIVGDGDPVDICVLTEKEITHGDLLLRAVPIGGLRLLDRNEADDKLIAVLEGDAVYGEWRDISSCPRSLVDRLRHYFLTYKQVPGGDEDRICEIPHVYGRDEALEVIRASHEDYRERFAPAAGALAASRR